MRHDLISAVFAVGGEDDLVRLLARVAALDAFLKTEDGANLLVAYQRAANIVRIEEKHDKLSYQGADLAIDQLVEEAECALGLRVLDSEAEAEKALAAEDFTAAMAALAKLRQPVDDFFDRVTVNTENPELRANRLRLFGAHPGDARPGCRLLENRGVRTDTMTKWVYGFGGGAAEGGAAMRELLGGKGANLAEMSALGLPVPPGFTLTTEVCNAYTADGKTYPQGLAEEVASALAPCRGTGRHALRRRREPAPGLGALGRAGLHAGHDGYGAQPRPQRRDRGRPGAPFGRRGASPTTATAAFIQMFGDVVLGVEHHHFEEILGAAQGGTRGVVLDTELDAGEWRKVIGEYQDKIVEITGAPFPQAPEDQLWAAIGAVFEILDEPARAHLPAPARHPRGLGHRGQRPGHGVRKHGRGLRHRGRLHPQPLDRRERPSTASTWSMPKARTWSPASARPSI